MAFRMRGSSFNPKHSTDVRVKKYTDVETYYPPYVAEENNITPSDCDNILSQSMVDLQTENKTVYIDTDTEYEIPQTTKEIFLSMVAGGGSGGSSEIKDGLCYSGGGGGGGGSYVKLPIKIENNSNIKLNCKIGKGGNYFSPNGTDTIVELFVNNKIFTSFCVRGGMRGGSGFKNNGGNGGEGYLNTTGSKGSKGTISLMSHNHNGGCGGSSSFYKGGHGFSYLIQDKNDCNGRWGSGGGGLIPGIDKDNMSNGGNGFVLIELL